MFTLPAVDVPGIIVRAATTSAVAIFAGLGVLFLLFIGRLMLRRHA